MSDNDWQTQFAIILQKTRSNLNYKPSPFASRERSSMYRSLDGRINGGDDGRASLPRYARSTLSLPSTPSIGKFVRFEDTMKGRRHFGRYGDLNVEVKEWQERSSAPTPTAPTPSTVPVEAEQPPLVPQFSAASPVASRIPHSTVPYDTNGALSEVYQQLREYEHAMKSQQQQIDHQAEVMRLQSEMMRKEFSEMQHMFEHEFNARVGVVSTKSKQHEEVVQVTMEKWKLMHMGELRDFNDRLQHRVEAIEKEQKSTIEGRFETMGQSIRQVREAQGHHAQEMKSVVNTLMDKVEQVIERYKQLDMKIEGTHSVLLDKIHATQERSREEEKSLMNSLKDLQNEVFHRFEHISAKENVSDELASRMQERHSVIEQEVNERVDSILKQSEKQDKLLREAILKTAQTEHNVDKLRGELRDSDDQIRLLANQASDAEDKQCLALDSIRSQVETIITTIAEAEIRLNDMGQKDEAWYLPMQQKMDSLLEERSKWENELRSAQDGVIHRMDALEEKEIDYKRETAEKMHEFRESEVQRRDEELRKWEEMCTRMNRQHESHNNGIRRREEEIETLSNAHERIQENVKNVFARIERVSEEIQSMRSYNEQENLDLPAELVKVNLDVQSRIAGLKAELERTTSMIDSSETEKTIFEHAKRQKDLLEKNIQRVEEMISVQRDRVNKILAAQVEMKRSLIARETMLNDSDDIVTSENNDRSDASEKGDHESGTHNHEEKDFAMGTDPNDKRGTEKGPEPVPSVKRDGGMMSPKSLDSGKRDIFHGAGKSMEMIDDVDSGEDGMEMEEGVPVSNVEDREEEDREEEDVQDIADGREEEEERDTPEDDGAISNIGTQEQPNIEMAWHNENERGDGVDEKDENESEDDC